MSEGERIRVMVVDDHSIMRDGLKLVLEQSGEFEVVGQAADGEEAVRVAAEVSPDVVVMDVIMPNKDGVEACREIMESAPDTRVVMLTASTEESAVVDAVAAGATGYLQKETDRERLLATVRGVFRGELFVPVAVVRRVFSEIRNAWRGDPADGAGLTPREREILVAFARGMSYARIAEARGVKSGVETGVSEGSPDVGAVAGQSVVEAAVRSNRKSVIRASLDVAASLGGLTTLPLRSRSGAGA